MPSGFEVHPDALRDLARLLSGRAAALSALGTLSPAPDAGQSSEELQGLLRQLEGVTGALAREVTAVADGLAATVERYDEADHRVSALLDDLGMGPQP